MMQDPYQFELSYCAYDLYGEGEEFGRVVQFIYRDVTSGRAYRETGGPLWKGKQVVDESVRDDMLAGNGVKPPKDEFDNAESMLAVARFNHKEYHRALKLRDKVAMSDHVSSEPMQEVLRFYEDVLGYFAEWYHTHQIPLPLLSQEDWMRKVKAISEVLAVYSAARLKNNTRLYTEAAERSGVDYANPADAYRKDLGKHFPLHFNEPVPANPKEWELFVRKLRESGSGMAE